MTVCVKIDGSNEMEKAQSSISANKPSFMINDILSEQGANAKRKPHHEFNILMPQQMMNSGHYQYDSDGDPVDDTDCNSVGSSGEFSSAASSPGFSLRSY